MPNKLSDLVIDEVSLVRKGANQHAKVTIAKSVDGEQEGQDMDDLFDEDGNPVDLDQLADGEVVFDEDGNGYEFNSQGWDDDVEEYYEPVGKSFSFRDEFSKALTDDDRDAVVYKALDQADQMTWVAKAAQDAAEHERQERIFGQYMEVAKSYSLPFDEEELALTMKNVGDILPIEDQEVIKSVFDIASSLIEATYGQEGSNSNSNVLAYVNNVLDDNEIAKSDEADAMVSLLEAYPGLYEDYLNESR